MLELGLYLYHGISVATQYETRWVLKVETVSTFCHLKVDTVSTFYRLKVETVSTFYQLKVETPKERSLYLQVIIVETYDNFIFSIRYKNIMILTTDSKQTKNEKVQFNRKTLYNNLKVEIPFLGSLYLQLIKGRDSIYL